MPSPKKTRLLPATDAGLAAAPIDLLLLAGIPNPLHATIQSALSRVVGARARTIAVSSTSGSGPLYKSATIDALLRGAGQLSIRRLQNRGIDDPPRPRRIALFYVPAADSSLLLSAFDFFVFPIPLTGLDEYDDAGRQLRHNRAACEWAIATAAEVYQREFVGNVQPRIENRRSNECLLLPAQNFHLPHRRLRDFFLELTRRTRSWEGAVPESARPELFGREQLPGFLGYTETQMIYRDARDVVFPCARPTEYHWREPEWANAPTSAEIVDVLRNTYRFGAPMPPGFHHDAQLEWGAEFVRMPFDCSRDGTKPVSGSHASVYPNDYVRLGE